MKAYRRCGVILFSLTSALDGGEWLTPCPGRFKPGKMPGTHLQINWQLQQKQDKQ